MFSAWNFSDWIASLGAALVIFWMVATLSLLIAYAAMAVLGEEGEASEKTGLSESKTDTESGARRAA